jgi:rRNA maturation endonuclease Nob1
MSAPKRAVLDTSAILAEPRVLARVGRERLLIPEVVVNELTRARTGRRSEDIGVLIQQATGRGAKVVRSLVRVDLAVLASKEGRRLGGADLEIAQIASEYVERLGSPAVVVVTQDRALQRFLADRGIRSQTALEFLKEPSEDAPDVDLEISANSLSSSQRRFALRSVLLGLASSIAGNLVFANLNRLIATVSVWGTLGALPVLGVALFWYRQRYRLAYGIFEFVVGVMMAYYPFFPNFSYSALSMVQGIQILGGLYVMVRGLDNVGKGIEGTRGELLWRKWFA